MKGHAIIAALTWNYIVDKERITRKNVPSLTVLSLHNIVLEQKLAYIWGPYYAPDSFRSLNRY